MSDDTRLGDATAGEDVSDLVLSTLSDRRARNAAELETITRAYNKYIFRARRRKPGTGWLTEDVICCVHREMFGGIWAWAGKFRTVEVNIGVTWHTIPEQVRLLCDDFKYWDSPDSAMSVFEVAARLQNRLTRIHPFKNGNGRHARLMTDIFFYSRRHALPQWPQLQLMIQGDQIRQEYIAAMKKADGDDYSGLMAFIQRCCEK